MRTERLKMFFFFLQPEKEDNQAEKNGEQDCIFQQRKWLCWDTGFYRKKVNESEPANIVTYEEWPKVRPISSAADSIDFAA